MISLRTKRLDLRPYKSDDLPHMQRYGVREDYWRYLALPQLTPVLIEEFLLGIMAAFDNPAASDLHLALEPKALGRIAGGLRLGMTKAAGEANLGYALDSEQRGQGYATEAVHALLTHGFETLKLRRICATVDVDNVKSQSVLKRAGLSRERRLVRHQEIRGEWRYSYLYAVEAGKP